MKRRIKWITSLKHSIIFIYHHKKLSTERLEILDYCINSMFCLNCDFLLIISLYRGRLCLRLIGFSLLYREYCYVEDRFIQVLSHTFYCNFCRDIEYSSLYQEYRLYQYGCIGVLLHLVKVPFGK